MASEGFLNRWSRLKRDAAVPAPDATAAPATAPSDEQQAAVSPAADDLAANRSAPAPAATGKGGLPQDPRDSARPLPALHELNLDSDYSPFMRAEVDPAKRMSALKKLFSDPHFNRMDGLDVYIDDYTKPDPIPKAMLARLNQSRLLGLFEEDEKETNATKEAAGKAADAEAPSPEESSGQAEELAEGQADGQADGQAVAAHASASQPPTGPAPAGGAAPDLTGGAGDGAMARAEVPPPDASPDSPSDAPPDSTPASRQAT